MRKFNVYLQYKKKKSVYRDLIGKKALKIAEDLDKKGFLAGITTESISLSGHFCEGITLKQMQDIYSDFDGEV